MATPLSEQTVNALIQKDISYMRDDITEIKGAIKALDGVYATSAFVSDSNKAFELRIKRLEDQSNLWRFLSPTLAAVSSSGITFLLINYIQHIK